MIISVTASKARCDMFPLPMFSDAFSGVDSIRLSLRQTLRLPTGVPSVTGAGTGPL